MICASQSRRSGLQNMVVHHDDAGAGKDMAGPEVEVIMARWIINEVFQYICQEPAFNSATSIATIDILGAIFSVQPTAMCYDRETGDYVNRFGHDQQMMAHLQTSTERLLLTASSTDPQRLQRTVSSRRRASPRRSPTRRWPSPGRSFVDFRRRPL